MNLIKLPISRPTIVVVLFTVLAFFGILSFNNLNQELMPNMSTNVIYIGTVYPGAGASEVENSVTKKIEDAVSSLEGVDDITSVSMENYSSVIVQLKAGTDVNLSLQNAQRKINAIRGNLPDDAEEPSLADFGISDIPIMTIGATSRMEETEFCDLMDNEIKPRLERIPGIGSINLIGGQEREIQVNLNEERMSAYGLSIREVSNLLVTSNLDFPTGKVKSDNEQILIRLQGKYQNVNEIENLVLKYALDGTVLKVKDIAEVSDTYKEAATLCRVNGIPSIGITVKKSSDANTVEISKAVLKILNQEEEHYNNQGLDFVTAVNNAEFTEEASQSVMKDLVLAVLLVALTMLLFLHSIRNAVFVSIAIPLSLVSTFIFMYLLGFSLNLMSLLGLTLVVGILVDDAIVVIENIHRHAEMGKKKMQAAYDGIKEIGSTILSITLVLVVVFVPISLTHDRISDIFRQFALTIAIATSFSLLVSFTVVPLLYSRFGKSGKLNPNSWTGKIVHAFDNWIDRIALVFSNLLNWSFSHKLLVLSTTLVLLIGSVSLLSFGFIGSELAPMGDQGQFIVYVELPRDATIEQTNSTTYQAEEIICGNPLVKTVFTTIGAEENGQSQARLAEMRVKMIPYDKRTVSDRNLANEVKLTLQKNIPGAKIRIALSDFMGNIDEAPIQYYISGNNMDTVMQAANRILENISSIKGVMDAKISVDEGNPEISIFPDRNKMASLGVTLGDLGLALNNAFSGNTNGKFRDGQNEYDINIRLDRSDRKNSSDVENFSLVNVSGQVVKLKQFAKIEETEGATILERRNRAPSVTVSCMPGGRSTGEIGTDINQMLTGMNLPASISIEPSGELKMQSESFGSIGTAILISLLLVYLIMVLLYNSYVYPFVVFFSIPLAVIGAFLAMALTMGSLNLFTMLGLLTLIGLVAKNAILVVDFTNQLKTEGMELKAALILATHKRFRPIVMTTLSMVIGMLPIALAQGAGAEWKNGLAWVIIGGLISSMFLTLVIVPLVYYLTDRFLAKIGLDTKNKIEIQK
ncbi:Multidrug resistance protein MdtC [termite gut metagenome]|uniref:Multidrug resistance protein MdtC n=1 Tax=termite gut metagenome TaxID=433724 RepID=A0A5J4RZA2_9ZZZZ